MPASLPTGGRAGDVLRVLSVLDLDEDERRWLATMLPPPDLHRFSSGPTRTVQAVSRDDLAAATGRSGAASPHLPAPTGGATRQERSSAAPRVRRLLTRFGAMRRLQRITILAAATVAAVNVGVPTDGWIRVVLRSLLVVTTVIAAGGVAVAIVPWARERVRRRRRRLVQRSRASRRGGRAGGSIGQGEGAELIGSTAWATPPAPDPLVETTEQREFATAIAARRVPGSVDVGALVDRVVRRRRISPIPRRLRWTVGRGVVIHAQQSHAMEPFAADVAGLLAELRAAVSHDAVELVGFDLDPTVISSPPRLIRRLRQAGAVRVGDGVALAEHLPPGGTTVLTVTDLGVGTARGAQQPASPAAWRRHHEVLRTVGCRVCYLVPYPPARWPPGLDDLPIIEWRDGLAAGEVRRRLVGQDVAP